LSLHFSVASYDKRLHNVKGAVGKFECWLVGPSRWEVRHLGVVVDTAQNMNGCFNAAQRHHSINSYYVDRAASGQSPLTAHR
jgi:hypothetical protein